MRRIILFVAVFLLIQNLLAQTEKKEVLVMDTTIIQEGEKDTINKDLFKDSLSKKQLKIKPDSLDSDKKKWLATVFATLLGPLGGHRLYLGTDAKVPVVYALTLGGAFILPIIDALHILFNDDLSKFENNSKIIMWIGKDKKKEENSSSSQKK
ncbi:MAG: TM2 domain-containing protein [Flavobacteriales bacterium]